MKMKNINNKDFIHLKILIMKILKNKYFLIQRYFSIFSKSITSFYYFNKYNFYLFQVQIIHFF